VSYNLQVQRNDGEIDQLHGRPDYEVCLESREVSMGELVENIAVTTT